VGIEGVDPAVRDAAEGMGMRAGGVLFGVEVPLGLALVISGIRSAASQVIATATIVAYGGLGGLGRFIIDGYSTRDLGQVYGGAVIVALLALTVEGLLALGQRAAARRQSPGSRQTPDTVGRADIAASSEPAGSSPLSLNPNPEVPA
jgi:osmoprotectant transport system permease protein